MLKINAGWPRFNPEDGFTFTSCEATRQAFKDLGKNAVAFGLEFEAWAWPGGYPIFYTAQDGGTLCPTCANENLALCASPDYEQWSIVGSAINYEDDDLFCDHCEKQIESAYGTQEMP